MPVKQLLDHVVEGDAANHQLKIFAFDEIGSGGANHFYQIQGYDDKTNPSIEEGSATFTNLIFQNGPINEAGMNGITNEALLAVVIDRMRGFQTGKFSCRENAIVLTHLEEALMWLQKRTRERIKRGVEGTHKQ